MEETQGVQVTMPIRCIVKLGGAAITFKHELEKINEDNLHVLSSQLRSAIAGDSCATQKAVSLDWSRRTGISEISCVENEIEENTLDPSAGFVVVHGAGSFGHFQASVSGVHRGGLTKSLVKAGFVATRISVTSLNLEIVRALARAGIPSTGMSPFSCGWVTSERNMSRADVSMVTKAVEAGFVPVLHGDAVLDESKGCTILSGDIIVRHLAEYFRPQYVVFLSDVFGVYDRPPSDPDANLLREIAVRRDGTWSVSGIQAVETSVAAHDTTGGMATKIAEAAAIAKLGINVYIVKAATEHSLKALRGELLASIPSDWLGTIIRFVE